MADRLERLCALAQWLQNQKGTHAAADKTAVADYGDAGFGFQATESIEKGEVLCLIPLQLTWSALTAKLSKEPLGPALRAAAGLGDDDLIALFLMHERAMVAAGTPGDRAAHVSCLPSSYDSTLFWTEEELAELAGCNLLVISARLQAQVEADFAALQETVLGPNPAAFPPAHCGLDAYKWALGTLWSRSMDFAADMFNNENHTPVCHAFEASSKSITVLAGRAYKAGEQVCINYGLGQAPAAACLRLYGFLPGDGRENISVELYVEMAPEAEAFDKKQRLLQLIGVRLGQPHVLTLDDPLPEKLLMSLRTQRLSPSEAKDMVRMGAESPLAKGRRVSASNERMALSALAGGLQAMLCQFASTQEEDEVLLAREDLSYRRRAAVVLRSAERRILHGSHEAAEKRLLELDPALDPRPAAAAPREQTTAAAAPAAPEAGAPPGKAAAEILADYFQSLQGGGGDEEVGGGGAPGGGGVAGAAAALGAAGGVKVEDLDGID